MVEGIPLAGGDGEVERECHDQDQPGQPVRVSDLAVLEAEATGFEVREHRLDAPTPGVVERGEIARGLGHGDNPGLLVAGDSSWPGSWMKPTLVRTRRAVSSTPVREGVQRASCSTEPASAPSTQARKLPLSRSL